MRALIAILASVPVVACASLRSPGGTQSMLETTPAAADSAAATAPPPARGAHVRVRFPATETQPERFAYGHLFRLTPDTVFMARGMTADTVLLGGGRTLEGVVRSHNAGRAGAALGLFAGALVGGAMGAAAYEPCEPAGPFSCLYTTSETEMMAGGAVIGGLLGGILGYAIGSAIRTEEWGTVPLAGASVAVAGRGLTVRFAF